MASALSCGWLDERNAFRSQRSVRYDLSSVPFGSHNIYGLSYFRDITFGPLVFIPTALLRRLWLRSCEGSCVRKVTLARR